MGMSGVRGVPPGSLHSILGLSVTPSHGNPSVPSLGGMALGQGAPCIWPNSSLPSGHAAEAQGTWNSVGSRDSLSAPSLQLPGVGCGGTVWHPLLQAVHPLPYSVFPSRSLVASPVGLWPLHSVFLFYSVSLLCLDFPLFCLPVLFLSLPCPFSLHLRVSLSSYLFPLSLS